MPDITITPKHARLQKFLAGKGINAEPDEPVKITVSDTELTSLVRKAKDGGFEDLIKVSKAAVRKAEKARDAETTGETRDEDPSDETTADTEIPKAEKRAELEAMGDDEETAPKRRRRAS